MRGNHLPLKIKKRFLQIQEYSILMNGTEMHSHAMEQLDSLICKGIFSRAYGIKWDSADIIK